MKAEKQEKKKSKRIILTCSICQSQNYYTSKSREMMQTQKKLELKKFCPKCQKRTIHKESK